LIYFKTGSIFDSDAEALVNPVNCVGVMGKGLALQFKEKYPKNYLLMLC
jgi:O-acetyl-ADP-ribose deacetylase (regulator of RNase III)